MATTVRVTVLTGPHKNTRYCFQQVTRCNVGRCDDCFVHLGGEDRDRHISRRHCQLEIDPPCVRVRDLGSLNGTYVNGTRLGPAEDNPMDVVNAAMERIAAVPVEDGGIITVGGTSLRIDVVDCPPSSDDPCGKQDLWREGEIAKRDCPIAC